MVKKSYALILAILIVSFGNLQVVKAETTSQVLAENGTILGTFKAVPSAQIDYELAIGKCMNKKCPIQVRLLEKQTIQNVFSLEWQANSPDIQETSVDSTFGVGDPLQKEYPFQAWTVGTEEGGISIVAQSFRLTTELYGLFVHQLGGFEHLKRQHYLLVAKGKQVKPIWIGREGAGPHWSAVNVLESERGGDTFCYFEGFFYPENEQADTLKVTCYAWNNKGNHLVKSSTKIYAVILDSYPNIARATAAKTENSSCFSDYSLLSSKSINVHNGSKIILAAMTIKEAWAQSALMRVRECAPQVKGEIRMFKSQK